MVEIFFDFFFFADVVMVKYLLSFQLFINEFLNREVAIAQNLRADAPYR